MTRGLPWVIAWFAVNLALANGTGSAPGDEPVLSATQIVEKNVAARGGHEAWRKIRTMEWTGHIEPGDGSNAPLFYVLDMKRPDKTRFEINAHGQVVERTFDGSHGWKLRPTPNGRPLLQPYSPRELSFAREVRGIGWPLMENQVKDVAFKLEGTDEVEGHPAYRLNLSRHSGARLHVWINTKSFLDVKAERESRTASGKTVKVSMFYRDYKAVDGVKLPFMIESINESGITIDKMVIDHVALNAPHDDRLFGRPTLSLWGNPGLIGINASRQVALRSGSTMRHGAALAGPPYRASPGHGE